MRFYQKPVGTQLNSAGKTKQPRSTSFFLSTPDLQDQDLLRGYLDWEFCSEGGKRPLSGEAQARGRVEFCDFTFP